MAYFHLKFGMDMIFVEASKMAPSVFQQKNWTVDDVIDPQNGVRMAENNPKFTKLVITPYQCLIFT